MNKNKEFLRQGGSNWAFEFVFPPELREYINKWWWEDKCRKLFKKSEKNRKS